MSYQIEVASINDNLQPKSKIEIHYQIGAESINNNLHAKSEIEIHMI
jgi:hypothetical protein